MFKLLIVRNKNQIPTFKPKDGFSYEVGYKENDNEIIYIGNEKIIIDTNNEFDINYYYDVYIFNENLKIYFKCDFVDKNFSQKGYNDFEIIFNNAINEVSLEKENVNIRITIRNIKKYPIKILKNEELNINNDIELNNLNEEVSLEIIKKNEISLRDNINEKNILISISSNSVNQQKAIKNKNVKIIGKRNYIFFIGYNQETSDNPSFQYKLNYFLFKIKYPEFNSIEKIYLTSNYGNLDSYYNRIACYGYICFDIYKNYLYILENKYNESFSTISRINLDNLTKEIIFSFQENFSQPTTTKNFFFISNNKIYFKKNNLLKIFDLETNYLTQTSFLVYGNTDYFSFNKEKNLIILSYFRFSPSITYYLPIIIKNNDNLSFNNFSYLSNTYPSLNEGFTEKCKNYFINSGSFKDYIFAFSRTNRFLFFKKDTYELLKEYNTNKHNYPYTYGVFHGKLIKDNRENNYFYYIGDAYKYSNYLYIFTRIDKIELELVDNLSYKFNLLQTYSTPQRLGQFNYENDPTYFIFQDMNYIYYVNSKESSIRRINKDNISQNEILIIDNNLSSTITKYQILNEEDGNDFNYCLKPEYFLNYGY